MKEAIDTEPLIKSIDDSANLEGLSDKARIASSGVFFGKIRNAGQKGSQPPCEAVP